jgi:hypothetical protein
VTKLRSIALLLLLALALRLGAGPHPCHGTAMPGMAKPGSCHGAQPSSPPPTGENDCCKKGHALCENACQTAAVLRVALSAPVRQPFHGQAAVPQERSLPLFVLTIDHVPLA